MVFTPTTWVSGGPPGISAAELNRIEAGIDNVDGGINMKALGNVTDNPSTYQDYMTHQQIAATVGPYNWPNYGGLLTINPGTSYNYMSQLLLAADTDVIKYRRATGASSWGSWRKLHTEGDAGDFTSAGHLVFAVGKQVKFDSGSGAKIQLDSTDNYMIGIKSDGNSVNFSAPDRHSFYKAGTPAALFRIDYTTDGTKPVLKWPNEVGIKEMYAGASTSNAYARGVDTGTLWDKTDLFYRLYKYGDTVGTTTPQIEVDVANGLFKHLGNTVARYANGTYSGDGTASRAFNIGFQPKMVIITGNTSSASKYLSCIVNGTHAILTWMTVGNTDNTNVELGSVTLTSTGFSLNNSTYLGCNAAGSYAWVAIG